MPEREQREPYIRALRETHTAKHRWRHADDGGRDAVDLDAPVKYNLWAIAKSLGRKVEDLVVTAINAGLKKAEELRHAELAKVTGGMNLPGMF